MLLPVKAKVVVVGGGVMGTSIAMHLANRLDPIEDPIVLLERAPRLAAGSSGRSGAILRQQYADLEVARMARNSLADYSSFMVRTGRDIGFRKTGVLTLAGPRAPEWMARVRSNVEALRADGVKTELVDAAKIRELFPGIAISDEVIGAWEPNAGFLDPVATVEAFAAIARTRGAITRLGVEVRELLIESGRVVGVETSEGRVDAEQVVLVAGPWTCGLLKRAGIVAPLRAVRPEQHFLTMPKGGESRRIRSAPDLFSFDDEDSAHEMDPLARIDSEADARKSSATVAHPVIIDLELGFYSRCVPEQEVTRIGRIEYDSDAVLDDPDQLDEEVSAEMKRWSREVLAARLPVYRDLPDVASEAALYTLTPDAQALLGPIRGVNGLFIASGFSGHGFKLAPAVGEGMCQLVLGEPVTAFDADFFSPARFDGRTPQWGGNFGL